MRYCAFPTWSGSSIIYYSARRRQRRRITWCGRYYFILQCPVKWWNRTAGISVRSDTNLPKRKDSERSVGFVTSVATQVASPEVISPDVAQGSLRLQVLQHKHNLRLIPATLTPGESPHDCFRCHVLCCWQLLLNHQTQTPRHSCLWSTGAPPGPRWLWPGPEQASEGVCGGPSTLQSMPLCTR